MPDLALVDFDHTVTTCDSYARFLRSIATPRQRARAPWTVGPWMAAYKLRLLSAAGLRRRVTRIVFSGRDIAEVEAAGRRYADEQLPALLRPEMMARIAWHQARGDTVVLVSGSLHAYLRPWCDAHGLALICNRLAVVDGRCTGHYLRGDRGEHKADDIRAAYDLSTFARVHAYGDSHEDGPMLALAQERWWRGHRIA